MWNEDNVPKDLRKYWGQRYSLFSRFDDGIAIDREGWYSVTPEEIARYLAERCQHCPVVIDAFCGVGGNAIQFAKYSRVIAIDINKSRLEMARHNAQVYGVEDRIEFIHGDYMKLAPTLKADCVFLSPPWGGPQYLKAPVFDLNTMMPMNGTELYLLSHKITPNICYYLPRNTNTKQLTALSRKCEVESVYLNDRLKVTVLYTGNLVRK
ncbi:RNA cap guanine-N2 methyltransferase-domain-containing protein [Gorgonomyces haynaldii]|nr:RNA cap guanine-N2 methyltransferase-domain-containing protein [Gorgonomyces haynaldii]